MTATLRKFLALNWMLLLATVALAGIGLVAIYSATHMRTGHFAHLANLWHRQGVCAGIGVVLCLVVSVIPYEKWLKDLHGGVVLYALGLVLLVYTHFRGEEYYGARSWISILGQSFQPSQLMILGGILSLAVFLSTFEDWHDVVKVLVGGVLVGGPCLLIVLQPDLGSALVWIPVYFSMLFVAGVKLRYLIALLLAGGMIIPPVIFFGLKDYQLERLTTFLDPEADPLGAGWTTVQSLIAIGSGGFGGKGFLAENTQNQLGFLPATAVHNDFIFAVLAEEHGFRGAAIVIGLFAVLLLTVLRVASRAFDFLGFYLCTGVCALLFTHVFLNVGMVTSVMPITGLPLPLVSYGGSFVLLVMLALGLVQSVWIHRLGPQAFQEHRPPR